MREGYEQIKAEYETRIKEWLLPENLKKYKDKSFDEITAELGDSFLPVGEVPVEAMEFFGVQDPRVYSGAAYFITHATENHGRDMTVADYLAMLDTLSDYDNIYIDKKSRDTRLVFSKERNGRFWRCVVGKDLESNQMIVYISYYAPSKNIDSGREKLASRVLGLSPYRPDNVTSAAVAISSLRDASNQTVSSDSEDVNLRSQPALGENAVERGQNKFICMAYDRFVRSIERTSSFQNM